MHYREIALKTRIYDLEDIATGEYNEEIGNEGLVLEKDVKLVLDTLESDVNDVISILGEIKGLDIIEEAVKLLREISNGLY